jgi:septal ring factor EnvC (AmiA/AmiB activator)
LSVQVEDLKVRVQGLLVNVYQQRSGRYARALSQVDSLHDLQVKNYYLSLLSKQDIALVTQLSNAAAELFNTQQLQSDQLAELESRQIALEENRVALENKQSELQAVINELDSTREGQLATRKSLLESEASLEASIADLQTQRAAEIARLQEEARRKREEAARAASALEQERLQAEASSAEQRATNLSAPPPAMSGNYAMPVASPQVLAGFGEGRSFVALKTTTSGAAVWAIQSGTILEVQFIGANDGFLVAIEHADGLVSVYTNLQATPLVRIGQQVSKGDILGYLGGSTMIEPDVLKLYVKTAQGAWIDPARVLGL